MTAYADGYIVVRCPKTGSTWTSAVVRQLGNGGRLRAVDPHCPVWAIPPEWTEHRRTLGTCRDPWSWYLSFHAHLTRQGNTEALEAFGGRDFRSFLRGATHGRGPKRMCGLVYLPHANGSHFERSGLGLATWLHRYFYAERYPTADQPAAWAVDTLIATEHLTQEIGTLFGRDASPWTRRNVGEHPTVLDAYNGDMLEWVRRADSELIDLFGWTPGQPSRIASVG